VRSYDDFIGREEGALEAGEVVGCGSEEVAGSDWMERGYVQRDVTPYFLVD
jgi:hypothetical protein